MLDKSVGFVFVLILMGFAIPSDDIYDQKGYYMFPIRPGEINYLSGSMGELRSTHFHAGIDIKTGGVQGYNVYSAADGFINRIKVGPGGYGKALYIKHPNNTFSVYAHLRNFSKDVEDWVRHQQYAKKSFSVDLFPGKRFAISKGDVIAQSGNTGSSSAPHLHFEIRDKNHHVLDPLRFGFDEIRDTKPPQISAIALTTLDINSRVNGKFGRFDFDVDLVNGKYTLKKPLNIQGKIGFEIYAFDRFNDTRNRYGIPCLEFYQDNNLVFTHHIKSFTFNESRNILVHTSYETMIDRGRRYHKMYVDDGNYLNFYKVDSTMGVVNVKDSIPYTFNVKLWDINGNIGELNIDVNQGGNTSIEEIKWGNKDYLVVDNVLQMRRKIDYVNSTHLEVYANRFQYEIEPYLIADQYGYYLWNLSHGLPDSVDFCGNVQNFNFKATIPSKSDFTYFSNDFDLAVRRDALFDTLFLQASKKVDTVKNREIFQFEHLRTPLRYNASLTLKPQFIYPDKERTSVYLISSNGNLGYYGGRWDGDQISFKTRDLVDYTIATDTIPPEIRAIRVNKDQIRLIIKDKMSGIGAYEATVNDEWVLMNYDPKRNLIWSEKLNENIPFTGKLVVTITDNVGNKNTFERTL
ncbi:MAG: M23 family metallopeptidase [Cyclobacteriaceae bacterium]